MRVRIRGPEGVSTISLPETATIADLRSEISTKTGIAPLEFKRGYPPEPLDLDSFDKDTRLSDSGIKLNGEQIIVSKKDLGNKLKQPLKDDQPPPSAANRLPPTRVPAQKPQTKTPTNHLAESTPSQDDPPELPLPSHDAILLIRIMPDDNSCLFRAISAAVLGSGLDSMHELRSIVAQKIIQKPEVYSAAVLEKEPAAYCRWIQSDSSWGGAIEIGILAEEFGYEIASINVQDGRVDRFNEGASQRLILVYSGIHYDVVAASPADRLGFGRKSDPDKDVKIFDVEDATVLGTAHELCGRLRERHYYTDTAGFLVKCNVCGWSGNGEKAATGHAKTTGHMDFGEA